MTEITRRTALGAAIAVPAAAALARGAFAADPVEIDLFFPVPGKLADKMKELIDRFNGQQSAVKATAVYTGSYDDTSLKTRAATKAGKPPGAVIMSANFVREYVINGDVDPFDPIIAKHGKSPSEFFDQFWPALKPNAMIDGKIYGIPYQNSTPLMYYNVAAFTDVGLDPEKPPTTWREWLDAAQKLTKPSGDRWASTFPALTIIAAGGPAPSSCRTAGSTTTTITAAKFTTTPRRHWAHSPCSTRSSTKRRSCRPVSATPMLARAPFLPAGSA